MDAGVGRWIRHGPIEVSVESVRLEKIRLRNADGEKEVEAFVVTTRTRFCGDRDAYTVFHPPFQPDRLSPYAGSVVLEDDAGQRFGPLEGYEFATDRRTTDAELDEDTLDVEDRLTFDPRAASMLDLTLTLPSHCRTRNEDGEEVPQPTDRPPFRFRLLRWMWE